MVGIKSIYKYALISMVSYDKGKTFEMLPIERQLDYFQAQERRIELIKKSGVEINNFCQLKIMKEPGQ